MIRFSSREERTCLVWSLKAKMSVITTGMAYVVLVDLGGVLVDVSYEGGLDDVDISVEHRVMEADVRQPPAPESVPNENQG